MKLLMQKRIILLGVSMFVLTGCATNASVAGMAINSPINTPLVSKSLENNINVDRVQGGYETNPLW